MKKPPKASSPCVTCPWHRRNQTPEAVRNSPLDGSLTRWFDVENLRDRWQGVANGQMMPCHATDTNAHLYGGKKSKAKRQRICVGLSTLAHREITAFMKAGTNYEQYAARPGERMTVFGLASWGARLLYQGAVFMIGRHNLDMPHVEESPDVCFPWPDDLNP